MKLKPGECDYPLPDCGLLESVCLDEGEREFRGCVYPMMQIPPGEWIKMRGDPGKPALRGRPIYFAWFGADIGLKVYPAPDVGHDLRVRYFGHLREA